MKLIKKLTLFSLFLGSAVMAAETDTIKKNLEKAFDINIESVEPTKYPNIYEVVTDETILYTDKAGTYILAGNLIDTQSKVDLTETKIKQLSLKDIEALPLNKAIKRVNGNGERKIITFEDPNCHYCKRLYGELDKIDNASIYTFIVPILGRDSVKKANNIWCSSDPNVTWANWMHKGETPESAKECDAPIPDALAVSRKFQMRGTPMILLGNGERFNGFVNASMIEEALKK
ncbi:DsbC family protein [Pelistega ratti]|uniref:DsbC family protein n=1 Tax=Pelistega ratti TaxID=2652177 RepID=UPI001356DEEC|nr:DsbC family protein [Pelistega ratti]